MATQDLQQLHSLIQELFNTISASKDSNGLSVQQRHHVVRLTQAIRDEVQPPEDHIIATAFGINLHICVRACSELGIFDLLSSVAPKAVSATEIAKAVGAEELLIVRFMRAVCALSFAKEVGPHTYVANKVTHAMVQPGLTAGYRLVFDNATRPKSNLWSHMEFFHQHGWKCPDDAKAGPYQYANNCIGSTSFEHWMTVPQETARFSTFMSTVRGSRPIWCTWIDIDDILGVQNVADDQVFMVDVAGGYGHDLQGFLKRYGDRFSGRMKLQDLPAVIDNIQPGSISKRIELQRHDFFKPQPVKGAKFYFMHMILHDWPDRDCVSILGHLRDAMKPGYSQILINDAILPDTDCPLIATAFDMTMMAHHCGVERSESMWRSLVEIVPGLELVKFWYPPEGEGIIQLQRI